jgi:hypothetical protein
VFKERELVEDWQQEEHLWDSYIETIRQLQHGGTNKQPNIINEESLQSNRVGLPDNSTIIQPVENNQIGDVNQQPLILKKLQQIKF